MKPVSSTMDSVFFIEFALSKLRGAKFSPVSERKRAAWRASTLWIEAAAASTLAEKTLVTWPA